MEVDANVSVVWGRGRAMQLIDSLCPSKSSVPASFARIIVGLFPDWFDFAADKFAVLAWGRGLHLIVSGQEYGFAIISTSDSRCMSCIYVGESSDEARMDMHYQPEEQQAQRARTVIQMALNKLFPDRGELPEDLRRLVPESRVFPRSWDGRVATAEELQQPVQSKKRPWWKFW